MSDELTDISVHRFSPMEIVCWTTWHGLPSRTFGRFKIEGTNEVVDTAHRNTLFVVIHFQCDGIHSIDIVHLRLRLWWIDYTFTGVSFWKDHNFTGSLEPLVRMNAPYRLACSTMTTDDWLNRQFDIPDWWATTFTTGSRHPPTPTNLNGSSHFRISMKQTRFM